MVGDVSMISNLQPKRDTLGGSSSATENETQEGWAPSLAESKASLAGAIVPTHGTGSTTTSQAGARYVRISLLRAPKFMKFFWLGNGQGMKNQDRLVPR